MNKERKLYNIPLLSILSIFITTYFVYNDFNLRLLYVINYGLLFLLLLLVFISKIKNHQKIFNFSIVEIIFLILPVVVILNVIRPDSIINGKAVKYCLTFILITGFILLSVIHNNEETNIIKIILICTSFIALCEAIYSFFPSVANFMIRFSSDIGKEYNHMTLTSGYAYAMGAQIAYPAYMMMLGIGASVAAFYKTKNKKYFILTSFYFIVMILLGRRGELLSIAATLIILFFIMDNPKKRFKHFLIFLVTVVCLFGVIILLFPLLKNVSFFSRYVYTIEGLLNGADITSGRTDLYKKALQAFSEHPFVGVGWGNFQKYTGSRFSEVHNVYLQFLSECGIFTTILISGSLIFLFVITIILLNKSLKLNNDVQEKNKLCQILIFSFVVQCFFFFSSMLDTIFYTLIFLLYYAVAICFTANAYRTYKNLKLL